jgi:hypothetical protein
MKDKQAADGQLAECMRVVRKGGRIKYARIWWQDERLKAIEGKTVMVCGDYWRTELDVFNLDETEWSKRHFNLRSNK